MVRPADHSKIPDPVPPVPLPDVTHDDLEKLERIGTGGDADVYRATLDHEGYTYTVAVKEPRFEGTIHSHTIEQFRTEAETWTNLNDHDNVVSVYAWDAEPLPWLALEYMDGGTLDARIGRAGVEEALWLAGRVAEGVRYGHRHGVAHLDLKPTNVLLRETSAGTWQYPKVSDWGLAKLLLEHSNSVEGISPTYAAPEQFDTETFGSPDDITDIYQLGAVTYALLTSEPPFTGSSTAVMRSVLDDTPRPPSAVDDAIPEAVDDVVLTALAKRKADRYEGVLPFRKALDRLFAELVEDGGDVWTASAASAGAGNGAGHASSRPDDGRGDGTPPSTATDEPSEGGPRLTRRTTAGLLGAGLVGAGGLWATTRSGDGGGEPAPSSAAIGTDEPSNTPAPTASETPAGASATEAEADSADQSSGATESASTADWPMVQYDAANTGHVTDRSGPRTSAVERWRFETGAKVTGSPVVRDGVVYAGSHDGALYAIDAATGDGQWRVETSGRIFGGAAVTDEAVFVGSEQADVYAVAPTTGERIWQTSVGPTSDYSVQRHTVVGDRLYTSTSGYGQVVALEHDTGEIVWRLEAEGGISSNIQNAPAVADGTVVCGSNNSYVYALRAADGAEEWTFDTGTDGLRSGSPNERVKADPTVVDGTVYVGNSMGELHALNLSDGTRRWTTTVGSPVRSSPAVADGTLYAGSGDGVVHAVDTSSGEVQWAFETGSGARIFGSPAITEDRIYFGSHDSAVYALSRDGREQWTFETGGSVGAPPAVVDGTVYVGSTDGYVYALTDEA